MKSAETLEIRIQEEVSFVNPFTAPHAVKPQVSPYFQPRFTLKVEKEIDWSTGRPRGPTVIIDFDISADDFE